MLNNISYCSSNQSITQLHIVSDKVQLKINQLNHFHIQPVIIIGAGVAGIISSRILTLRNISHLVIQSRNRIGGRLDSTTFQGVEVDLGAGFIHDSNNPTNKLAQSFLFHNWSKINPDYFNDSSYYQSQGLLGQETEEIIQKLKNQMNQVFRGFSLIDSQESLGDIADKFIQKLQKHGYEKDIIDRMKWQVQIIQNLQGASVYDISIKSYQSVQKNDYLPIPSYIKYFQYLFSKCKNKLKLQQKVIKINYQHQNVIVTTNKGVYKCKYLISTLPIGVLKNNIVTFQPKLPQNIISNIQNIGVGILNKIFVSFKKSIWSKGYVSRWVNFISKNNSSKYPIAFLIPKGQSKNIFCFFVSASHSVQLGKMSLNDVKIDLQLFLSSFLQQKPQILEIKMTNWHLDQHSLGSYSYSQKDRYVDLQKNFLDKPISQKIWFAGQHTMYQDYATADAAFNSGINAANQILQVLGRQKVTNIQQI